MQTKVALHGTLVAAIASAVVTVITVVSFVTAFLLLLLLLLSLLMVAWVYWVLVATSAPAICKGLSLLVGIRTSILESQLKGLSINVDFLPKNACGD